MTLTPTRADEVRRQVEPALRALVDRLDHRNRRVAGYQLGFWDADGTPTDAVGKGLRPAFALLAARAAGAAPAAGVPAAAAVELVHTFSLLHDDLMDGDTERRHRPTAWVVFGPGPAVLAGDALLSLAYEALAEGPHGAAAARRLSVAVSQLIAGQAADIDFEHRSDVTLDECLQMAADKTAALVSGACALGALVAGGSDDVVEGMSRFGQQVGLAFQLVDDLLGIWGEPERTGKPVRADLHARKRSVPVVRAATSDSPAGRAFAAIYQSGGELDEADLQRASRLIEEAGAREWTAQRADELVRAAIDTVRELPVPDDVCTELSDLAAFITGRDY
jgi:geranylgeranyl diphosphate synthase, type I